VERGVGVRIGMISRRNAYAWHYEGGNIMESNHTIGEEIIEVLVEHVLIAKDLPTDSMLIKHLRSFTRHDLEKIMGGT
jgi:hypothetical protein